MSEACKAILRASDKVFGEFQYMYTINEALRQIFYMQRGSFTSMSPPLIQDYMINADNEPARLLRECSSQIGTMIRPRGREWFKCTVGDPEDEPDILSHPARLHLEDCTKRMRRIINHPKAKFSHNMGLDDTDYTCFGNSVSTFLVSLDKTHLLTTNKHMRNIAWVLNSEHVVDEVHEKMMVTALMFRQQFGEKLMHKDIKDALDVSKSTSNPGKLFPVRRILQPMERFDALHGYPRDIETGVKPPIVAKFAVIYICETSNEIVKHEWKTYNVYHIRRWNMASALAWGNSIITPIALGDSRLLNAAERSICEAIEKIADPPLLAKTEAIIGSADIMAGGITFGVNDYDYKNGRPLEVAYEMGNPAFGLEYTERKRKWLATVFFESLLKLPADREMTLGEVNERIEELIRSAAPIFEPMESDNGELLEKVWQICIDMQAFQPAPEELQGADVRFEFDTPTTQAIDKLRVVQAKGVIEYTGMALAVDKNAAIHVNFPKLHRAALKGLGPLAWQQDPDIIDEQIEQSDAQAESQRQLAMMAELAKTPVAGKVADKALEATDPNVLSQAIDGMMGATSDPVPAYA